MALNFQPERTDAASLRVNQLAVERHLTDDHYVRGFAPSDFALLTATYFLADNATHNDWPTVQMADGVNSHAAAAWRKPSEWRSGKLRLQYWYTSNGGSTNNFTVYLTVSAAKDGEVMPGGNLLINQHSAAGPAVAWTIKRSSHIYTATSFGNDDEIFTLRLARLGGDASDTNANNLLLIYVTVEHIPAIQEAD